MLIESSKKKRHRMSDIVSLLKQRTFFKTSEFRQDGDKLIHRQHCCSKNELRVPSKSKFLNNPEAVEV